MSVEVARTMAEEYRLRYGGDHSPYDSRCTGALPGPAADDMSMLYYLVLERAQELGHDKGAFLARLRHIEDEGWDYLDEYGHPSRHYDAYQREMDAAYEQWEEEL